jgi:hypothetical protein
MGEPAGAAKRPTNLPPQVLETLKWLATTIGVTGGLLVIGFIGEFAYQDRLGYDFSPEDLTGYSSGAGRFLLSLVIIALSWISQHPLKFAGGVVLLAGFAFAWSRIPSLGLRSGVRLLALVILLGADLIILDLPTVSLQGSLVAVTPPLAASAGWPIGSLTRQVWQDEICSRIESALVPKFQKLKGDCKHLPEIHEQHRQTRFAVNALVTLTLVVLAGIALLAPRDFRFGSILSAVVLLLLIFDVLMLPYSYSKTVRPTKADDVHVSWVSEDAQAKFGEGAEFFLLYEAKDEVALLEKIGDSVWIIPRSQVRLFKIVGEEDVLAVVIRQKLAGVILGVPPVP